MKLLSFFLLIVTLGFTSCTTPSGGGGGGGKKSPYTYPEGKLGAARKIKTTSMDGRFVFLDDNSIWNIDWSDAKDAARWSPGQTVAIRRNGNNSYPYTIFSGSRTAVSARFGKNLD
jgi:hypothetical protein